MKTKNATMKKILIVLPLIIFFFQQAEALELLAGPYLEPSVTYERGDTSVNYPSPFSDSTGSANGLGVGARVGVHLLDAFFLGVDGRYSMPTFKDSSVHYDARSVSTNWGPVLGIQMPLVGLRVWGSYILGGVLNPKESGNFDVKFKDASGYRVGAGFKVLYVSLNFEYQHIKYGEAEFEEIGPFSPGTSYSNVNLTNNAWIASVSFPLAL